MRIQAALLGLILLALPLMATAQSKQDLAEQYVYMPEVQAMIDDMFSPQSMAAQFASSLPASVPVTEDQLTRIGVVLSDAMKDIRPRLEELMISGSTSTFSVEELQALIAFYQSEHGAAIMTKMQPFMTGMMAELGPEMITVQQTITPKLMEILQETQ